MDYQILHILDNLDEMAKPAKICPKCGKQITGNHYWYKGEWKCKGQSTAANPQQPTTQQPQQQTPQQQPAVQQPQQPVQQSVMMGPPPPPKIFEIEASMLPIVEDEIAKMNKKASKANVPPMSVVVVKTEVRRIPVPGPAGEQNTMSRKYYKIRIEGTAPRMVDANGNHWTLVASLDHTANGTIVNVVPGNDSAKLSQFYSSNPDRCDHCGKVRRRNGTFVVADSTGTNFMQVGRQCLKDFLGHESPNALLTYLAFFENLGEWLKMLERKRKQRVGDRSHDPFEEYQVSLDDVLEWTVAVVDTVGYTSSKIASEQGRTSTATYIRDFVLNVEYLSSYIEPRLEQIWKDASVYRKNNLTQITQIVDDIKKWVLSIPQAEVDKTPYYNNLQVLVKNGMVSSRNVGYAVSMYPAWKKATQQAAAPAKPSKTNDYVGTVGEKIELVATVKSDTDIDSQFGKVQLLRFEDATGNSLVWFNNGKVVDVEVGKQYNIKGTVKKQDEYNGRKQTSITRVKITANGKSNP